MNRNEFVESVGSNRLWSPRGPRDVAAPVKGVRRESGSTSRAEWPCALMTVLAVADQAGSSSPKSVRKPGPASGVTLCAVISSPQWVHVRRGLAISPQAL